jgi:hypothetical protein
VDRGTRNIFLWVIAALIVVTGTIVVISNTASSTPSPSASLAPLPSDTPQAVGVIVAIDAASLADVRSFTLRTTDDRRLVFGLAELQNGTQFAPGHLAEHQATAQPVRVFYRDAGGTLQALRLEDAHP